MIYLSAYDLLTIHGALLHEFGGMRGVTEAGFGRLEQVVAAPQQSAFGEELFPDLPSKAAALAHAVVRNHPFSDGNKRVALAALDVMLSLNGAALGASNDEAYALIMAAANGIAREEMVAWVRSHTTP